MKRQTDRMRTLALWLALTVTGSTLAHSFARACDKPADGTAAAVASFAADGEEDATPATPAPEAPKAKPAPRYYWTQTPMTPKAPRAPVAPMAPEAPMEMAPSRILPRGWFGFGLQCDACSANRNADDSVAVWVFESRPRVYSVELASPAARAGIQRGDVITHIDGISILTPDGGRRFSITRPGQVVRWTIARDGVLRNVSARAEERPGERARLRPFADLSKELEKLNEMTDLRQLRAEVQRLNAQVDRLRNEGGLLSRQPQPARRVTPRKLRYAGMVGSTEVEVRGGGSVIVSESENKNELTINTGESVVVIRIPESASKVEKKPGDK